MIDEGSNYHVAKVSSDKDADAAMSAIESMWFSWAGPMVELFFDAGVEFNSTAFGNFLQSHGIRSRVIAKEAHFQLGRCERHGGILQEMLRKIDHESPIENPEQLQQALNHSCSAKNSLSRCRGYTPEIIVLGRSPRLPGSVTSDDLDSTHALAESETSEGEAFRASLALRERARRAFVEADNASSLRRAYLGRSRPHRGDYAHGDWVMYWREAKENRPGRWHGPARVLSQDGPLVVWLSHSGRLFRCAPKHVGLLSDSEYCQISPAELLSRQHALPESLAQTGPFQYFDLSSQSENPPAQSPGQDSPVQIIPEAIAPRPSSLKLPPLPCSLKWSPV